MKKTIVIILVITVAIIAIYFVYSKNYNAPAPAVTNTDNPITNKAEANVTVNIKNFSFEPKTLTVKPGTEVTWVNNDSVAHTVTSDSSSILNSPTLAPGQSFSFTFAETGSINYHCAIHPSMKGGMVVEL